METVETEPKEKKNPIGAKPVYHKGKLNVFQKKRAEAMDFLLDHEPVKNVLDWVKIFVLTIVSAFLFAYGFRAFIAPSAINPDTGVAYAALISGGASGISQVILRLFQIGGYTGSANLITSVAYFVINVPLFFIAWTKVGHKFALVTILNVGLTSLFVKFLPESWVTIFDINDDFVARALIGGILTGFSSGLAYHIGTSSGGIDIISFAIAEKKSTTVGKYSIGINFVIVVVYTIVNAIRLGGSLAEASMALYTCIYFFTSGKVLDIINIKNKKTELQINTDNTEMAALLLRAFPHGCTVLNATGGYTGKPRELIYMVVSASEVKSVVDFVRKIDPKCFVNVTSSNQVYGNFYIEPIK